MTQSAPLISLADVEKAAVNIAGAVDTTPFLHSETLSHITGAELWLKFENLQFTGSFKQRGALNKLLSLSPEQRQRGVVAVSAGNHAQGVAYHSGQLGIPATIIMPETTPGVKVQRTAMLGAEVILHGATFDAASKLVPELVAKGLTFIHPFDDDLVIAGQGTLALEMLAVQPELDAIVVGIGGGGLIGGIATVTKASGRPISIIGVQSERYPSMAAHLGHWKGDIAAGASIAEGIAVITPGVRTAEHAAALVDDVIVVRESAIESAVALLLQVEKTLCEGAGAAGLAAVLSNPDVFRGKRVGLVLSGGNIDNRLLMAILQRQMVRDRKLFRLRVRVSDQAGALGILCTAIGNAGGNINSVQHDRTFLEADAKTARVELEIEVADPAIVSEIKQRLAREGFEVEGDAAA